MPQPVIRTAHERGVCQTVMELSERELHVLQMIVDGLGNKQIEQVLGTSRTRTQELISNLIDKCGAANRIKLVVMAVKKGWVKT
jgi:DNA-binding NarL/FixJ family response regulator